MNKKWDILREKNDICKETEESDPCWQLAPQVVETVAHLETMVCEYHLVSCGVLLRASDRAVWETLSLACTAFTQWGCEAKGTSGVDPSATRGHLLETSR